MRGPGNKAWLFWLTAFLLLPAPWLAQPEVRRAAAAQFAFWFDMPPPPDISGVSAAQQAGADARKRGGDCKVISVHDGDTANVLCGVGSDTRRKLRVRLHCIDAPELDQAPWGREARDALTAFANDKPLRVDEIEKDRYGRTVGVLWADGVNLNLEQVRAGHAAMYPKYCREPEYAEAEREAREHKAGVWGKPGLQQAPWEYRHQ